MTASLTSALAVQQRTLDRVRFAIAEVMHRTSVLYQRQAELEAAATAERLTSFGQPICFDAYFRRLNGEQAALARDLALAHNKLEELRERARDEMGTMKALERAVQAYADELQRAEDIAEQASADDRHSAEVVRLARRQRQEHAR